MHDLVFPVTIDRGETYVWKTIHQALIEQLRRYKHCLKFNEDDLGVQFNRLSWDILAQKKPNKKGKSAKYLFEPGLAGPASFTLEFLREQAFDPDMENQINDHSFILIGLCGLVLTTQHLLINGSRPKTGACQRPHFGWPSGPSCMFSMARVHPV